MGQVLGQCTHTHTNINEKRNKQTVEFNVHKEIPSHFAFGMCATHAYKNTSSFWSSV